MKSSLSIEMMNLGKEQRTHIETTARTAALITAKLVQLMLDRDECDKEITRTRTISFKLYALSIIFGSVWGGALILNSNLHLIGYPLFSVFVLMVLTFFGTASIDALLMNKYVSLNQETLDCQIERAKLGLTGEVIEPFIASMYEIGKAGGSHLNQIYDCYEHIVERIIKDSRAE